MPARAGVPVAYRSAAGSLRMRGHIRSLARAHDRLVTGGCARTCWRCFRPESREEDEILSSPAVRADSPVILLSAEEAADMLRIGRTTLYSLLRSGDLGSIMIGRRRSPARPWRITCRGRRPCRASANRKKRPGGRRRFLAAAAAFRHSVRRKHGVSRCPLSRRSPVWAAHACACRALTGVTYPWREVLFS